MTEPSIRFLAARAALAVWPFARGRSFVAHRLIGRRWPDRADVPFRYGRLLNASLKPWPEGFRELWCSGIMEGSETSLWLRLLRRGDVVFDGGANSGYWSLVAAHAVGEAGRVVAFEPVPDTAEVLRGNLAASSATNVGVVEAGLAAAAGTTKIYLFEDDPASVKSSMGRVESERVQRTIDVKLTTIWDAVREGGRAPALIKLDVEGAEWEALRGAGPLLESDDAPILTIEWNEKTAKAQGYRPEEMRAWLEARGYRLHVAGLRGFEPVVRPAGAAEWSPMVWAVRPGLHDERLAGAGVSISR